MPSVRDSLTRINIPRSAAFSLRRNLRTFPPRLRDIMRATLAPGHWEQVNDAFKDESWTDEVQGVAWDGANWLFSCNANQSKPGHRDKALYTFPGGSTLKDGEWSHELVYWRDVPGPVPSKESNNHWGQLTAFGTRVYVSHFWEDDQPVRGKNVVVFQNAGGQLSLVHWVKLDEVTSSDGRTDIPEFQAINPWDGQFYTCLGGDAPVREFFVHEPTSGAWTRRTLPLSGTLPWAVQGACFSPNGHLYVAVDRRFPEWGNQYKWIFSYSALNGAYLGRIPVLAEEDDQELEGLCVAATSWADGRKAQVHVVLLENRNLALDNVFFKSFSADLADSV